MSETDNNTAITGDRGQIQDGRNHSANNRPKVIVGLVGLTVAGYFLWTIFATDSAGGNIEVPRDEVIRQTEQFREVSQAQAPLELASLSPPELPEVALPSPEQPYVFEDEETDPLLTAAQRAPVLVFSSSTQNNFDNEAGGNEMFADAPMPTSADAQRFGGLMQPTVMEGAKAGLLGNRNLVVAKGTSIPCILETALNSDQPGFTSCIVNRDILSDNGRVVLLDKGTQIVGEYHGGLQKGQARLFVLWTRAKTPNGVIINLASPATDALGRAGFDGRVNTHWWQRFGSAMLLSVIGDATKILSDQLNNNNNIQINESANAGKEAAGIALENQINIPPTLEKHHGEMVNIFVARDLDFSSVYRLKVTESRNRILDRAVTGDFSKEPNTISK